MSKRIWWNASCYLFVALMATACETGPGTGDGGEGGSGNGSGGTGGSTGGTGGNVVITGLDIYAIQDASHENHPELNSVVSLEGVVVTGVEDGSDAGFFAQVAEADYDPTYDATFSGIYCFRPQDSGGTAVSMGDEVTIEGNYVEFPEGQPGTVSQLIIQSVTVTGSGTIPTPALIADVSTVATGGSNAEAYEGVLIRIENVGIQDLNPDAPSDYGVFVVDGGLHVDNDLYLQASTTGRSAASLVHVQGLLHYAYSTNNLLPRMASDILIVPKEAEPYTIYQIQDRERLDAAADYAAVELINVVVTAVEGSGNENFFVQVDPIGLDYEGTAEYSGIYCTRAENSSPSLSVGEVITLEGIYQEFFDASTIAVATVTTGGGNSVVTPTLVNAIDVANPDTDFPSRGSLAEAYEGVLIRVDAVDLVDPNPDGPEADYGEFVVDDGLVISNDIFYGASSIGRLMSNFYYIIGVQQYAYSAFKMMPRNADDLDGELAPLLDYTIYQVQDRSDAAPAPLGGVRLVDVVVTAADDDGLGNFWIQMEEADYDSREARFSGIHVFREEDPGNTELAVGDLVTVEGIYEEFFGLSRISPISVLVTGAGAGTVPAGAVIDPANVATGGSEMEDYEGVLIRAENVDLSIANPDDPNDYGEFVLDGGLHVDNELFWDATTIGRIADSFVFIQGVLTYAYESAKMLPRDAADIEAVIGTATGYSIYQIQDRSHASAAPVGLVSISDVVVTAVWDDGMSDFFVQVQPLDQDAGYGAEFSGILIAREDNAGNVAVAIGDVVDIDGLYGEFFDLSRIVPITVTVTGVGTGTVPPAEVVADPALVATGGADMETWESVLIAFETVNLGVANPDAPSDYGQFSLQGGLLVDDDIFRDADLIGRAAESFTLIQGVLNYSYSESKLLPRMGSDIDPVLADATPYSIYQIQDRDHLSGAAPEFAIVRLEGVVVTAVEWDGDEGFYVQHEPDGTGWEAGYGATFSGIHCSRSMGSAPVVMVGDVIDVEGIYSEYWDLSEIGVTSVSLVGTTTPLAATLVNAGEVATNGILREQYEGVLVRMETIDLELANPDAPADYGQFSLVGGLVVDDVLFPGAELIGRSAITFGFIQGVMSYSYSEAKLYPRDAADMDITVSGTTVYTIYQIQDRAHTSGVIAPLSAAVRVENVVVTGVRQPTGDFFVQVMTADQDTINYTLGSEFSGINCSRYPDAANLAVAEGDILNVEGIYTEYFDESRITVSAIEYVGAGTMPAPTVVDPAEVATGGALAVLDTFEGVLIQVDGIAVITPNPDGPASDFGEWLVTGNLRGEDLLMGTAEIIARNAVSVTSITGLLTYSYSNFKLAPRKRADFVADFGTPTVYTIYDIQDRVLGTAPEDSIVRIENVVVTSVADAGLGFLYVQIQEGDYDDVTYATGAEYSGILAGRSPHFENLDLVAGDLVNITGYYMEYWDNSELVIFDIEYVGAGTVPATTVVTTAGITTGGEVELYEGVLVEVQNVTMVNLNPDDPDDYGAFEINDGVTVGNWVYEDATTDGRALTDFTSIIGPLYYGFSTWTIFPRSAADISGT